MIEKNIERIADSIENIEKMMREILTRPQPQQPELDMDIAVSTPVVEAAPTPVSTPVSTPVVEAAPVPTPVPVVEPAPVPTETKKAPFNDNAGLIQYVGMKYKQLGSEKGQIMIDIMKELGYDAINQVDPKHYDLYYTKVEAL